MKNNKVSIGIHTPPMSTENYYTILGGTKLEWEDESWGDDLCDSIGTTCGKYYIMFPNSTEDNFSEEKFNHFILANKYIGNSDAKIHLVSTNILEIIKYINTHN